ncbi:ribulose-phosphate 3-epimerase [uncultured Trichococcus sp.]|uniref:ribulose-phosphate 3-epimerase n=1 Tax=uncultured Trichococcus sp. TaxID=189665 RepID=UPI002A18C3F6|nr:ribulose-phosphate 3-epimerase [uncultured Trichococcus sp.]
MSDILICPSMMCANFANLENEIHQLAHAGSDIFHIDIMDGEFVPNFGMGIQDFELIRKSTNRLVDVHLMIKNPSNYVEKFADMGADIIYFHPETDLHPTKTIDKIKGLGKQAGIAINPGTSIDSILELLPLVDFIMVMTVNPGFSGQKYLDFVDNKINRLLDLKADYEFEILVDGAISSERIQSLSALGVKGFVLGTSALFGRDKSYSELITEFKAYNK